MRKGTATAAALRFDDGWDDGSDGVLCRLFAEDTVGTPGLAKRR